MPSFLIDYFIWSIWACVFPNCRRCRACGRPRLARCGTIRRRRSPSWCGGRWRGFGGGIGGVEARSGGAVHRVGAPLPVVGMARVISSRSSREPVAATRGPELGRAATMVDRVGPVVPGVVDAVIITAKSIEPSPGTAGVTACPAAMSVASVAARDAAHDEVRAVVPVHGEVEVAVFTSAERRGIVRSYLS